MDPRPRAKLIERPQAATEEGCVLEPDEPCGLGDIHARTLAPAGQRSVRHRIS